MSPIVVLDVVSIRDNGSLIIEPGVVVKLKQNAQLQSGRGRITVIGTPEEPIIFTAYTDDSAGGDTNGDGDATTPFRGYWFHMTLSNDDDIVQHAEFRYGKRCLVSSFVAITVSNTKFEHCDFGVYHFNASSGITIKDNIFENNLTGILAISSSGGEISGNRITASSIRGIFLSVNDGMVVRNNEIKNNRIGIEGGNVGSMLIEDNDIADNTLFGVFNTFLEVPIDFRNNWWGDTSGPFHPTLNPAGLGNPVSDGVLFDPVLLAPAVKPPGRRPVLIVPGILGTELKIGADTIWLDLSSIFLQEGDPFLNVLAMDENGVPINNSVFIGEVIKSREIDLLDVTFGFNVFQALIDKLKDEGYEEETDIFFFPYDWRKPIGDNSLLMENKISDILDESDFDSVDIVAHSQGGLVSKSYVEFFGDDKINKLIFAGTPHLGSVKAGKAILFGEDFEIPLLSEERMKFLVQNMPSVYQLLPREEYFGVSSGYLRPPDKLFTPDPLSFQETKDYILNNGGNSIVFNQAENYFNQFPADPDFGDIEVHNIIGCKSATMREILIFNQEQTKFQIVPQAGDGTVPLISADSLSQAEKYYVLDTDPIHGRLPSLNGVKELITQILTNQTITLEPNISLEDTTCGLDGKQVSIHSPVELHIFDQFGNHTGPVDNLGLELGIPGVSYDILGDNKFAFLPTESGQTYNIELIAEDQGSFDARISTYSDDTLQSTSFFNGINITPSSTAELTISSTSTDDIISLDFNGTGNFQDIEADLIGNPEEIDDFTSPEFLITFNPELQDYVFTAIDDIDQDPSVVCTATECVAEDNVGNSTVLTFTKSNTNNFSELIIESIKYNNLEFIPTSTLFKVMHKDAEEIIKQFTQRFLEEDLETLRIHYKPEKDESDVFTLNESLELTKETFAGLKFLQLETTKGLIRINIL